MVTIGDRMSSAAATKPKHGRGRPKEPAAPGTMTAITLRVPADTKNRLGGRGLTQSQDGALRLLKSLEFEDHLDQPLSLLAGGEDQMTDVLRAIATAMAAAGMIAVVYSAVSKPDRVHQGYWFDDPYAASKAIEAAHRVLDLFAPDAAAVVAAEPQLLGEPAASLALAMLDSLPKDKAKGAVERVLSDPHRPSMLGPAVREQVLHHLGHVRERTPATDVSDATIIRGEAGEE
jgi:hypothetical protein